MHQRLGLRADHLGPAGAIDDAHDVGRQVTDCPLHPAQSALAPHLGVEVIVDKSPSVRSHNSLQLIRSGASNKLPGRMAKTGRGWGGRLLKVLKSVDLLSEIF